MSLAPFAPPEAPRCAWCLGHPLYIAYHDREWGTPSHDDSHLFEMLILEGAQAGLSWLTILKKRAAYARAYAGWDAERVARFGPADVARLLEEGSGIVRNRLKVECSIRNARAVLDIRETFGSFDRYAWRFTEGRTLRAARRAVAAADLPCESAESRALSRDLVQRGCRFAGPVIAYSWMQACGLVDDHLAGCFRCGEAG